jgi:uncharacterized repeat protein (TIGR01451 family)
LLHERSGVRHDGAQERDAMRPDPRRWFAAGAFAMLLAGTTPVAWAAGTRAGTVISNVADVSYTLDGVPGTSRTAPVILVVGEVLQVSVAASAPITTVASAPARAVIAFRLVNTGNGSEAFRLALDTNVGGDFTPVPAVPALYLDTDGSGTLTPADLPYVPGSNDPVLAPDGGALVFAVLDVPAGTPEGARARVRLDVRAVTGVGPAGTTFPAAGDGGVDAIAGAGGAQAAAPADVLVSAYQLAVVKSAAVLDATGGTRAEPGARVTYDVTIAVTGSQPAPSVTFRDPIPAFTTYVPGSLTLDGVAVPDATGFVPGVPSRIQVPLGDVAPGTTRRVQFAVTID